MNKRQSKLYRVQLRKFIASALDYWGPLADAITVFAVSGFGVTLVILFGASHGYRPSVSDLIALAVKTGLPIIIATISTYFISKAKRQQGIFIEATLSYIIHGGKTLLDEMLGKMISGRWKREQIRPGDALFNVLIKLCIQQDWELKRRVAEALPVLSSIDLKRSLEILSMLREDWHVEKWKSDLRRRAIEALVIPFRGGAPLLFHASESQISKLLRLRSKDQVYTAMAVVEAISEWEATQPKAALVLWEDLFMYSKKYYIQEENDALLELRDFLDIDIDLNFYDAADRLTQMSESENMLTRVCAARNLWRLDDRFPDKMLDLMFCLSLPIQHYNVRRPIAKERSMDALMREVIGKSHRTKADLVLSSLISDPDEIIRVTAFEKIEQLAGHRDDLLLSICASIRRVESSGPLFERAERIIDEMKDDDSAI
jgi:hypothetical protein